MFKMLVDTCVWLDVAKDPRQVPVVGVIEEMVKHKLIELIVPRMVLDEFQRNRGRVAKEISKSLSTHIRLVKDAVAKIGGDKRRMRVVLSHLDDVNHKIPIVGGAAVATLDRIDKLLAASVSVDASDNVTLRAAERGSEESTVPSRQERHGRCNHYRNLRRMRSRQDSLWNSFLVRDAQQERLQRRERQSEAAPP